MTYTTNLNLKKPAGTDFYNVQDFNDNADLLDTFAGNASKKSYKFNTTLTASNWNNGKYKLSNIKITATSPVELLPRENEGITATQMEALVGAMIVGGTQSFGSIYLVALGDVPDIDIPVTVIVRGDL